jgi:hypothetical protein
MQADLLGRSGLSNAINQIGPVPQRLRGDFGSRIISKPVIGKPSMAGANDFGMEYPIFRLAAIEKQVPYDGPRGADIVLSEKREQLSNDLAGSTNGGEESPEIGQVEHAPRHLNIN